MVVRDKWRADLDRGKDGFLEGEEERVAAAAAALVEVAAEDMA